MAGQAVEFARIDNRSDRQARGGADGRAGLVRSGSDRVSVADRLGFSAARSNSVSLEEICAALPEWAKRQIDTQLEAIERAVVDGVGLFELTGESRLARARYCAHGSGCQCS